MNPRYEALSTISRRCPLHPTSERLPLASERFGRQVFSKQTMKKLLPEEVYGNIIRSMEGKERIRLEFANTIAQAMQDWALQHGATHYCHWFQPLTGTLAEKHDSFLEWKAPDLLLESFSGKQLIQGEPDASSFPSGGLRSTYEARGYTAWDTSSPAFLWKAGDGVTLCIPSIFYSWTGETLDTKIPLLKSDQKINTAVMRLLALTGTQANYCFSSLGLEQEYFIIDKTLRNLRPDLLILGRTICGSPPPKGQELEDHYFGVIQDRILAYMKDFEEAAIELGIPLKTRHNEVAPSQYEVAPIYERSSLAIDHNMLLMELMRQKALKHNLCCLLHEKPFNGINGSGKHSNWSISTDTGLNLLDPSDTPENSLNFLILLAAVLNAVFEHADLLRGSIGSAGNDLRLGANEAPPAIISVYLGEAIEELLNNIELTGLHKSSGKNKFDPGLPVIPELPKDNSDRNRTSPFAFTGNKFEFRAVGSSANAALPITVLNVIVAQSLNQILDEIESLPNNHTEEHLNANALQIIRKYVERSKKIRFSGDNYSDEWHQEAEKRGLPNCSKSFHALEVFKSEKTAKAFENVLTPGELLCRYEVMVELYYKTLNIETNLLLEMFHTQILPACLEYQEKIARSILAIGELAASSYQKNLLKKLTDGIDCSLKLAEELEKIKHHALSGSPYDRGTHFCDHVNPKCGEFRKAIDHLETIVDDRLWPLPKYRELLFLL